MSKEWTDEDFFKGLGAKEKNQTICHPVHVEPLTQSDKFQYFCV